MKKILTLSLVMALALALVGCNDDGKKSGDEKFFVPTIALSSPTSMDMSTVTDSYSLEIITNVVESLLEYNGEELVPTAAESFTVSDDGLVYTFELREDGKWFDVDGKEVGKVVADDFVYAWQRMVDPEVAASYSYIYDGIVKNATAIKDEKDPLYGKVEELGVVALDDYTLEVTLEQATPFFEEVVSFAAYGPANKEAVEKFGDNYGLTPETMYYSGVYRATTFNVDEEVVLTKNEDHWDADSTDVPGMRYQIMADASTIFTAYKNGEVDRAGVGTAAIRAEVDASEELSSQMQSYPKAQYFFMSINKENGATKNKNVRKAIVAGFDAETYIKKIRNSNDSVLKGYVPAGLTTGAYDGVDYREVVGDFTTYDPDNAAKYVEAAKKELGTDEIKIDVLVFEADTNRALAEYLQAEMAEIGITVNINLQPSQAFWDALETGGYNLGYSGWTADYGDPSNFINTFFNSSLIDNTNYSRTNSPEIDKELAAAEKIVDAEERFEAYGKIEAKMVEEASQLPVLQVEIDRLINPSINMPYHSFMHVPVRYITYN